MKKIIQGVKYDTDTATLVFTLESQSETRDSSDFYMKKNGNCFVVCGEHIEPVSREYIEGKAELILSVEEYEAIFGEVAE